MTRDGWHGLLATGLFLQTRCLPRATRWVQVDLRESQRIEVVKLYPKFGIPGDHFKSEGFPLRFRIDVSDDAGFRSATAIADETGADYPDPVDHIQEFRCAVRGRYVGVTATSIRARKWNAHFFALARVIHDQLDP